ncbi:MAG TPA: NAD-dependent epimerase/dehydratase family protein [Steroidobacteraceae bacterium]
MILQSEVPTRTLVTGATGFVGRALLSSARDLTWRAAVRSVPGGMEAEVACVGDIDEKTDWNGALADVDCVVHLAAHVHVMNPSAQDARDFERINVLGTERLARAAAKVGVKRFIYLSSIKVNGEKTEAHPFRADDPPAPKDEYGRSKLNAERLLAAIEAGGDMRVAVIRPPLVYGPSVRGNFKRLLALVNSGLPLPLGSVRNKRSLVSVWNLCDLIGCLVRRAEPASGVFLVADDELLSTAELVRRMALLMHRRPRLLALPPPFLNLLGKLTGRGAEVRRLCDSLVLDTAPTRERLGWTPPLPTDAGLERTVSWYLGQLSA